MSRGPQIPSKALCVMPIKAEHDCLCVRVSVSQEATEDSCRGKTASTISLSVQKCK